MTNDVNDTDIFQFLNWSYKKLFSMLIKIWCFHMKLAACFENVSFLYMGSYCIR